MKSKKIILFMIIHFLFFSCGAGSVKISLSTRNKGEVEDVSLGWSDVDTIYMNIPELKSLMGNCDGVVQDTSDFEISLYSTETASEKVEPGSYQIFCLTEGNDYNLSIKLATSTKALQNKTNWAKNLSNGKIKVKIKGKTYSGLLKKAADINNKVTEAAARAQPKNSLVGVVANTLENRPTCSTATPGSLVYVLSTSKFYTCSNGSWTVINLDGANGTAGTTGADADPVLASATLKDSNIGINVTNPISKLHISGEVRAKSSGAACSSSIEGSFRYNSTDKVIEYCYVEGATSAWKTVGFVSKTVKPELYMYDSSGYGSTDTAIFKMSNTGQNSGGTLWTVATAATTGTTITINEDGIYSMTICAKGNGATAISCGFTVNASAANRLVAIETLVNNSSFLTGTSQVSGEIPCATTIAVLTSGDIVRPHGNSAYTVEAGKIILRMAKIR